MNTLPCPTENSVSWKYYEQWKLSLAAEPSVIFPWCFSGWENNSWAVLAMLSTGTSDNSETVRLLAVSLLQLLVFTSFCEDHTRSSDEKSLPKALKPLLTSAGKHTGSTLMCKSQLLHSNLLQARCFWYSQSALGVCLKDDSMPLWRNYLPTLDSVAGLACDLPQGQQDCSLNAEVLAYFPSL